MADRKDPQATYESGPPPAAAAAMKKLAKLAAVAPTDEGGGRRRQGNLQATVGELPEGRTPLGESDVCGALAEHRRLTPDQAAAL